MLPSEKSDSSKTKANEHSEWVFSRLMKACVTTTSYVRIKLFLPASRISSLNTLLQSHWLYPQLFYIRIGDLLPAHLML